MRVTTLPAGGAARQPAGQVRPPFSVVVVTYNTERTNEKCLTSVLRSLGAADELIVVDNASVDSTPDYLRSLKDPRLQIVLSEQNAGYSIGMNQGLRLAKGEHVVMLNPDTQVPPRWLERMRAHFRDARVGAVGPVSDRAGGCQRFEFYLPQDLKGGFGVDELGERIYTANAGKALEAKTLIGFCLMVSRRALDAVGPLDEDLVLGNDDLEYCLRLRNAGFKVVAATDVFVHHEEQVSFQSLPSETTRKMVQESTDALARKLVRHYGEGQVPSSRELFGVDWFKPSFDVWPQAVARIPLSEWEKDPNSGVSRHPAHQQYETGAPVALPHRMAFAPGERVLLVDRAVADLAPALAAGGVSVVAVEGAVDLDQIEFDKEFDAAVVKPGVTLRDDLDCVARVLKGGGRLLLYPDAGLGKRELLALLLSAGFDGAEFAEDAEGSPVVAATRERP